MKIKVAIVYPYFPLYREAICSLLCSQDHSNIEYTLISGRHGRDGVKTIDPSKAFLPIENGGLRWRFVRNLWFFKFLWQTDVLKIGICSDFDVIVYLGQFNIISTVFSAIFAQLTGKRVLMWSHGFIQDDKSIKNYLRELFYRLSDGMLLYGNRAKDIMIRRDFDIQKLYVVYNSLDYAKQELIRNNTEDMSLSQIKKNLFLNPLLPVVIFVGRLTSQKKLNMIIEAAKINIDAGKLVNILIVGDGRELQNLKYIVDKYSMDDYVNFYGSCYDENELCKLIMMSDVCVSPGEVGLTAVHSLAYGTPVITHDNFSKQMPEYEAIEDGVTGSFFEYNVVESLALKISEWLFENKRNKRELRQNCISVVENFYNAEVQVEIINAAVSGISSVEVNSRIVK